jgi:putative methylase
MKKRKLEMALQKIPVHPNPDPRVEQYPTPAHIAADVLYIAHSHGDIENKMVMDLGCGSGIFAVGAKLLGASSVIGMDVDEKSIEIARDHAHKEGLDIDFRVSEIKDFNEKGDTVVQNPPFGAQNKGADRPFLEKALALSNVVYSLHLSKTHKFIEQLAHKLNSEITLTKRYDFEIRHTFTFHSEEKKNFDVTMFRLKNKEGMK